MELIYNNSTKNNYDCSTVIGHEKQLNFLKSLYVSGRIPPGLLFHGQKNIGKKFAAIAFAASVLCEDYALNFASVGREGKEDAGSDNSLRFCGKCPSCSAVLNGISQHFLIIESSAGSIKIDDIHKAAKFLSLAPAYPGYRFVIIGEASHMNASSANALLKILEEPPEKTVFILITSSAGMLLPTVISRCQLTGFHPVPEETLFNYFKAEFPDIENVKLKVYSKLARGSFSVFRALIEGNFFERRHFLINSLFKPLFEGTKNFYDISSQFGIIEKAAKDALKKKVKEKEASKDGDIDMSSVFESILLIFRDIYIYFVSKNEKLLYNEDIAEEIKELALSLNRDFKGSADKRLNWDGNATERMERMERIIENMMDYTAEYIEKINGYNPNKSIALDSYFSKLFDEMNNKR